MAGWVDGLSAKDTEIIPSNIAAATSNFLVIPRLS
jgi:hypothetical protein